MLILAIKTVTEVFNLYNLSRASYEKEWGTEYHKPSWRRKLLRFLLRIILKIGPFKAFKISTPTPGVEKLFMASLNATIDRYKALLANVDAGRQELPNVNFDAGEPTRLGKYKGADEAYAKLVGKLADRQFAGMKPDLRQNILEFYKDLNPSLPARPTKKEKAELTKLLDQLDRLKAVPEAVPEPPSLLLFGEFRLQGSFDRGKILFLCQPCFADNDLPANGTQQSAHALLA